MRNAERVLLAVIHLYVQIEIHLSTLDTNNPVTGSTQSVTASVQKLPNSVVKSISRARHRQSRCVKWNDQVIDQSEVSRWYFTCNVHNRWGIAVAQWLRCCATNRKVAGSIPASVIGFFIDIKSFRSHYGPGVDSASNRNEYQEHFLGVKAAGV